MHTLSHMGTLVSIQALRKTPCTELHTSTDCLWEEMFSLCLLKRLLPSSVFQDREMNGDCLNHPLAETNQFN